MPPESPPSSPPEPPAPPARVLAYDWLKGVVMVLMALDHAGMIFNQHHETRDSWMLYGFHLPIDPAEFFTRFVTHLCAPTFLFLGGVSLALSCARRRTSAGPAAAPFDRDLLVRGLLLLAIDVFWWGRFGLEVLYPFGAGYLLLIGLRRLPRPWLAGLALLLLAGGEIPLLLARHAFGGDLAALRHALELGGPRPAWMPWFILLAHPGKTFSRLTVLYPLLPWLGVLLLGWVYGSAPRRTSGSASRPGGRPGVLAAAGCGGLGLFVLIRGGNGYGNMLLPRYDASLVQWLHLSKYPPGLAFLALQLGLMALALAVLLRVESRRRRPAWRGNPLLVFGRTPLFFYVLHMHLMKAFALAFGLQQRLGLGAQYAATLAILVIMYGLCSWYDGVKSTGRWPWLRYL